MSEAAELERIGAVPQKNSGRGKHNKGDGVLDGKYLVDVKESEKTFGLSVKVWSKVCTDAGAERLEPTLLVVLGEEGTPRTRLIVITDDEFEDLRWKAGQYDASA